MMTSKKRSRLLKATASICILFIASSLLLAPAGAMYIRSEIVNVPVDRLVKNLESRIAQDPSNASLKLNLARLHAMAYALKTDTAEVVKGREGEGPWFGYEPKHVPFENKSTDDPQILRTAKQHLAKAIETYQEVLELEPDNLTASLGHAWCVDQAGETQRAIEEYRELIKVAWSKEKDKTTAGLGWHSITAEAAGYLILLLDPQSDKEEIRTLRERSGRLNSLPRPVTPIVIPLRDGVGPTGLEDPTASVPFDADGTGLTKRWTWITNDAGWLVFDPRRTGKVESALQMFGSVTFWLFWNNGYEALSALDDDGDGLLRGKELEGLAVWQDLNRNGVSEPGEVKPLADWNIVALSCEYVRDDQKKNTVAHSACGVFFRGGTSRATYDLILKPAVSSVD